MSNIKLRKEWADKIAVFKASGLTQSAWCKEHKVKPGRLSYWLRKESSTKASNKKSTTWIPLETNIPKEAPQNNTLHIIMGPAIIEVKHGFDEKLLLATLKTLSVL